MPLSARSGAPRVAGTAAGGGRAAAAALVISTAAAPAHVVAPVAHHARRLVTLLQLARACARVASHGLGRSHLLVPDPRRRRHCVSSVPLTPGQLRPEPGCLLVSISQLRLGLCLPALELLQASHSGTSRALRFLALLEAISQESSKGLKLGTQITNFTTECIDGLHRRIWFTARIGSCN